MEDYFLIRRIKAGDKQAFEQLVEKHYDHIYAYCFRRTGNREAAMDLAQNVFLKLVAAIYRYQCTGKFQNFLFTIAVNTCNDFLKTSRNQQIQTEEEQLEDPGPLPESQYIRRQENQILYQRLQGLPEIQKEALILYYYQDLKIRDIARITGVSVSTVKSRLHQGIGKLRKLYEQEASQDEV